LSVSGRGQKRGAKKSSKVDGKKGINIVRKVAIINNFVLKKAK